MQSDTFVSTINHGVLQNPCEASRSTVPNSDPCPPVPCQHLRRTASQETYVGRAAEIHKSNSALPDLLSFTSIQITAIKVHSISAKYSVFASTNLMKFVSIPDMFMNRLFGGSLSAKQNRDCDSRLP